MRKNLHHKIMLSILAGSLALGFVYAPPAFAEDAVDVEIADGEEYNLNADYTISGTDYNDASITLPTGPIGTFTVTAGNGGETIVNWSTDGKGGSISLSAIGNIINNGISVTAGNGGKSYYHSKDENVTGGAGGDVTLTFTNIVNGNITASAGNGGNIEPYINGNLTSGDGGIAGDGSDGGDGGDVTLTFNDIVVTDSISLTSGMNGTGNGASSTPGNGGSVTFEAESISGTTSTSDIAINLTKKDGDITFDVGTLNIDDNTVKITATGDINIGIEEGTTQNRKANHIDNLILTGNGNIDTTNASGIKIGQLTIDGGTIISDSSTGNAWTNIILRKYSNNTITIGTKGATFNMQSSNNLTKSVTGTGNLTKTGAGTL